MKSAMWMTIGAALVVVLLIFAPKSDSPEYNQPAGTDSVASLAELVFGPSAEVTAFREMGSTSRTEILTAAELESQRLSAETTRQVLMFAAFLALLAAVLGATYIFRRFRPVTVVAAPPKLLVVQRSSQGELFGFDPVTQVRIPLVTAPPTHQIRQDY